jgi:hypothetical protein
MGTGIMEELPLSFHFGSSATYSEDDAQENKEVFRKYAARDFFDFYTEMSSSEKQRNNRVIETISDKMKPEILLQNFKDFFFKLHELIGDCELKDGNKKDTIAVSNDLDKFMEYFDDQTESAPTTFPYFEAAHIVCCDNLLIHRDRFKAILEEYSSCMERLWVAMEHLLAKTMKIGMSQ